MVAAESGALFHLGAHNGPKYPGPQQMVPLQKVQPIRYIINWVIAQLGFSSKSNKDYGLGLPFI